MARDSLPPSLSLSFSSPHWLLWTSAHANKEVKAKDRLMGLNKGIRRPGRSDVGWESSWTKWARIYRSRAFRSLTGSEREGLGRNPWTKWFDEELWGEGHPGGYEHLLPKLKSKLLGQRNYLPVHCDFLLAARQSCDSRDRPLHMNPCIETQ